MPRGLKKARLMNLFTQQDAADFLDISLRSYKSYENDEEKGLKYDDFKKYLLNNYTFIFILFSNRYQVFFRVYFHAINSFSFIKFISFIFNYSFSKYLISIEKQNLFL